MIQDKIIAVAKSYIGKTEKPNNSGFNDAEFEKRMAATGWSKGLSWCSYFCELVWCEAYKGYGVLDEVIKNFDGSATATYKKFDLDPTWEVTDVPTVGSLAVWRYGNGWQGHIAIVVEVPTIKLPFNPKSVVAFKTVEGNTNDKGGREGYIVAAKTRKTGQPYSAKGLNLIGFIKPKQI